MAFEDLGVLEPLLLARGYTVDYLEAGVDPITPERLSAPDVVVVLGGPIGVGDTALYAFLSDELTAIAARLFLRRPTLGICLGAQLIAAALGAAVTPTGKKEIGYSRLALTPTGRDSILSPLDGVPVLHWHGDQFAIPAGSVTLAETPGFPPPGVQPRPGHPRPPVPPRSRPHAPRTLAHRPHCRTGHRGRRPPHPPRRRHHPRPHPRPRGAHRLHGVARRSRRGARRSRVTR
ncbi:glutamine amidotransferase-related protein [Amycolatopsis carbonis]|uniref:glutamine amidotransferase-related protein n=1 Tax=Amycolatopsis carbonis TaxID=715471 RepID=UPI00333FFE79